MPPKPTDEFGHGQMMGMLVIIQLFERARDSGVMVKSEVIEKIKGIAGKDLAQYMNKPEEDVYLLVENKVKGIR